MSDNEERAGAKRTAEDDLASKMLTFHSKRFYIDVKQNPRGRFVKISEIGNVQKSRIALSMSATTALVDTIKDLIAYSEANPAAENPEETQLKTVTLNYDTRRYYVDLKQNTRGRFLRIAQTISFPKMSRSQVVFPDEGMTELKNTLEELIKEYADGYLDHQLPPSNLPEAHHVRAANGKTFFLDVGENDRGTFVRISEVKNSSGYRAAITVPSQNLTKLRDALGEIIEQLGDKAAPAPDAKEVKTEAEEAVNGEK